MRAHFCDLDQKTIRERLISLNDKRLTLTLCKTRLKWKSLRCQVWTVHLQPWGLNEDSEVPVLLHRFCVLWILY